ncbi:DEAD/DEAH box helicase [Faecalibacillus intestinalis]|uniref:DEAD/DEAH box helicase n=1 Tax=Faecalibacillus intestinalis TaxID=1982626 RepID=UPI00295F2AEF|nr:DEAD/DEAH box helicase [Faecalibacillus intestinalis]
METFQEFQPRLVYNNYKEHIKVSHELELLFKNCDSFELSVAFIADSGLAALKECFDYLRVHHIRGKIITSTYLGFNAPSMFKKLLKYENIEVKIFEGKGFHPKGYIFHKKDQTDIMIGSSNLTQNALAVNQEWNLFFSSDTQKEIVLKVEDEFNKQWKQSIPLTNVWIEDYQKVYVKPQKHKTINVSKEIKPNYMQKNALESLDNLRKNNKDKALLISATVTGKTYLAAFDVKAVHPKRMLFVVHRRSIAIKAMETFKTIIKDKSMGLFSGDNRDIDCDYIFATIQTIYKPENRQLFSKEEFNYIIIDEVHKAGAHSYQKLVNYFKPQFLLGMSATPERTDDFDIYKMFNYNIAYEIRLQQAMEYDLLCPFHYYGITDITINDQPINDMSDFNLLVDEKRVDYVIDRINDYGYSGDHVHGLIFVSRKEEACKLSEMFNQRGFHTCALTGEASEKQRQEAMDSLESNEEGSLDYIFTVDIFNEGIDIPKVNQVVMLRSTQSSIIFIQQLGRGLRKNEEKDYVVVIDFIGNYKKNFFIPIALSGNTNLNKDNLRRFVSEGNLIIPGASTIQFDEISKKRIFDAIDAAKLDGLKLIKEKYFELKNKLGRIPKICDFEKYGSIDIQKVFQNKYLRSYHELLKKYEDDYTVQFTELEEQYLKFISNKLSSGKRIQELETIRLAIEKKSNLMNYLKEEMKNTYNIEISDINYESIINYLTQNFAAGTSKKTYEDVEIIDKNNNISPTFSKLLLNNEFKRQVIEVLDYSIQKYKNEYNNRYKDTDLCLYKKYTFEDVCRLLNWEKNLSSVMFGYRYDEHTNTLPIFVNYEKEENISDTTKYNDRFVDPQTFIAISKSNMTLQDDKMIPFINANKNHTSIHIFIRKNKLDEESKEFYYLGLGNILNIKQETMANNSPVCEILYQLDQPVRKDIYDYIVNN